jgi:threonine aldolase
MSHNIEEILAQCTNVLPGHGPRRSMKEMFQGLADALTGDEYLDHYGSGSYIAEFEDELAKMFGQETAVFLPSGTMAQQIALRIWCQQRHNFTVAMHPTAHLEWAEHSGYQFLHHIQRLQFGAPEFLRQRILEAQDFDELGQEPGVILLELPYRPLGGRLPSWDELTAVSQWAHQRHIPLHLDGARIWSCRPFYQKTFSEIAALFDSIYISFYKDLGGLSGAMLLGSESFIKQACVWQIRHGGRLVAQGPSLVSARMGLQRTLPQIDQWVEIARAVAKILNRYDGINTNPNPPHTNMFQLFIQGDPEALTDRHVNLARETGTFLFHSLGASAVPGIAQTELHCWENALAFDLAALPPFIDRLLSTS